MNSELNLTEIKYKTEVKKIKSTVDKKQVHKMNKIKGDSSKHHTNVYLNRTVRK